MEEDRIIWEKRHAEPHAGEPPPSAFLQKHANLVRGRVLDVACGRGRNAIFLARRGNVVEAIDIAFAGLLCARQAATAENLSLRLIQADVDDFPLPTERYDAVVNVRFLKRRLFPTLASALKPGGILVFETFLIDQMHSGHPRNPDFLLRHGELRDAFAALEPLEYEEGLVDAPDGKAYMARLLARRPDRNA